MTDIYQPAPDLYTAGQPAPDELALLVGRGVRTVINLRAPTEAIPFNEAHEAERLGLRYVNIPVTGAQDLTPETIRRFSDELAVARGQGAVLVHCGTANRVGALLALDQGMTQRVSREDALAFGRRAGLSGLEPAVDDLLGQHDNQRKKGERP